MIALRTWLVAAIIAAVVAFGVSYAVVVSQGPSSTDEFQLINYGTR